MINRRIWIKKSIAGSSALAFSGLVPFVIPDKRTPIADDTSSLRLHWNENPYGPSQNALNAVTDAMARAHHYPDDQIDELKKVIANRFGLAESQVLLTVGSTEALGLIGRYIAESGKDVLMSQSSFPTIGIYASRFGARVKEVPIGQNGLINLSRLAENIEDRTGLIFLCNPNNPTSTDHSQSDLRAFCESVPDDILICVDEAYIHYGRNGEEGSMAHFLNQFPNILICRTFSKAYGLAGMRIGYALGPAPVISDLGRRRPGFDFASNIASVLAAKSALKDDDHLSHVVQQNEIGRKIVYDSFDQWGVKYAKSATNFIYAESARFDRDIVTKLRNDNILITKWPSMKEHIRISIGRPDWMQSFVHAAEKYVI